MLSFLLALAVATLLQGVHSAQWSSTSPQDGDVKYVCEGGSVTLDWNYILSSGDVVGDVQWFYDGSSQEMVAMFSHGNFLPLPVFANRVKALDNAGIIVSHLTVADSGNYSVEINVFGDSGTSRTVLRQTVFVRVSDRLMSQDGYLHVTQRSEVVLDTNTDQWAIPLQCGTFTFLGQPPFNVEWITPSGVVVNSSDFSDNHFNLLLTNPVQGGNYTCRIPPRHADDACLHGNVQASVNVDRVEARLSLLEKENEQLKEQLKQSNSTNTQVQSLLKHENEQLKEQLKQSNSTNTQVQSLLKHENEQLKQSNLTLSQQVQTLEQVKVAGLQNQVQTLEQVKVAGLQNRVEALEDRTRQQIGFHATGLQSATPPGGTPLIVNNVLYNHGNAYSGTTGYFTTPHPGVYFFAGTTGHFGAGSARHYLYVDDTQLSAAYTAEDHNYPSQSTVHAVVHLTPGQRVWIRSSGDRYTSGYTTFSGFLISLDP